ncbi:hypothetical protein HGM15179_007026 [Zosterops borbonicus]|uniref:Uncharacterized protein n=1 Tax=Zosterops borbonicus TaxID=364589 RepID=A0A8K1LMS9_9PASS|nr:hypothetical protein HGM15179_007026 [Zosterops borbonicus]
MKMRMSGALREAAPAAEHRSANTSTPHRVIFKRNQSGKEGVAERDILLHSFLQVVHETKAMDEQVVVWSMEGWVKPMSTSTHPEFLLIKEVTTLTCCGAFPTEFVGFHRGYFAQAQVISCPTTGIPPGIPPLQRNDLG